MRTNIGKSIIAAGVAALLVIAVPFAAFAGVDVSISIPLFDLFGIVVTPSYGYAPAPAYGYAPPPSGYVAPPAPAGAVFYGGYWYLPSGGSWYISAQTNGPWVAIGMDQVPYAVISGPVLMPESYSRGYNGPSVGVTINPWIHIGGGGRGHGHGHGHDD
ncbi:MAG: hypothetical protein ACYC7L_07290 [Nitrospirota bacterium]